MRPLQAHCHRGLGTLYATTASGSRPVPHCRLPIALYRAMEMMLLAPVQRLREAQLESRP